MINTGKREQDETLRGWRQTEKGWEPMAVEKRLENGPSIHRSFLYGLVRLVG
jgi:hypothetical protein